MRVRVRVRVRVKLRVRVRVRVRVRLRVTIRVTIRVRVTKPRQRVAEKINRYLCDAFTIDLQCLFPFRHDLLSLFCVVYR